MGFGTRKVIQESRGSHLPAAAAGSAATKIQNGGSRQAADRANRHKSGRSGPPDWRCVETFRCGDWRSAVEVTHWAHDVVATLIQRRVPSRLISTAEIQHWCQAVNLYCGINIGEWFKLKVYHALYTNPLQNCCSIIVCFANYEEQSHHIIMYCRIWSTQMSIIIW